MAVIVVWYSLVAADHLSWFVVERQLCSLISRLGAAKNGGLSYSIADLKSEHVVGDTV